MTHSQTLIGTITDKARAKWDKVLPTDVNTQEFREWEKHWLDTARNWLEDLHKEKLFGTADAVKKIIEFFGKVHQRDNY